LEKIKCGFFIWNERLAIFTKIENVDCPGIPYEKLIL
jgi:hypothetical protein